MSLTWMRSPQAEPACTTFGKVHRTICFKVWLDAGIQTVHQAAEIHRAPLCADCHRFRNARRGPEQGRAIIEALGPERLTFSLDLQDGRLIGACAEHWADPEVAAEALIAAPRQRLIILDLVRVGESDGTGTDDLCRKLIQRTIERRHFRGRRHSRRR